MLDKTLNRFGILTVFTLIAAASAFTHPIGTVENQYFYQPAPTPAPEKPPFTGYKGITIGTKADEVRAKLGAPTDKSDEQDSFVVSGNESAQIYYDAAKTVTAITVTFTGKLDGAPTAMAVFGEAAEVKPDGGIFKMVRYPKAGFWISYNKIVGSDGMIMIALQKL